MAPGNAVIVKNISQLTQDQEVKDFFAFCGKIADFQVATEGGCKTATVTFEKPGAVTTAVLLSNTQLGPNSITVTSAGGDASDESDVSHERESDELTQEEKPRSRIFAEYLAHGYVVGDAALQKAIALDQEHNVSSRFLSTLQQLDAKYHATDRAKTADQSYGITQRANSLLTGLSSYFEKATNNPTGKRIVDFYTSSTRQVHDIHDEARRLAELKKQDHGGSAAKASGLERFLGTEKAAADTATDASTSAPAPGASSETTAKKS